MLFLSLLTLSLGYLSFAHAGGGGGTIIPASINQSGICPLAFTHTTALINDNSVLSIKFTPSTAAVLPSFVDLHVAFNCTAVLPPTLLSQSSSSALLPVKQQTLQENQCTIPFDQYIFDLATSLNLHAATSVPIPKQSSSSSASLSSSFVSLTEGRFCDGSYLFNIPLSSMLSSFLSSSALDICYAFTYAINDVGCNTNICRMLPSVAPIKAKPVIAAAVQQQLPQQQAIKQQPIKSVAQPIQQQPVKVPLQQLPKQEPVKAAAVQQAAVKVQPAPAATLPIKQTLPIQQTLPVQQQTLPVKTALPVQQAPVKAALPVQQAPIKATLPVQQAPVKATLPVQQAPVKATLPVQQAPIKAALPVQQAPIKATLPVQQAPIKAALPVQQAPIKAALPVQQAPIKATLPIQQTTIAPQQKVIPQQQSMVPQQQLASKVSGATCSNVLFTQSVTLNGNQVIAKFNVLPGSLVIPNVVDFHLSKNCPAVKPNLITPSRSLCTTPFNQAPFDQHYALNLHNVRTQTTSIVPTSSYGARYDASNQSFVFEFDGSHLLNSLQGADQLCYAFTFLVDDLGCETGICSIN